MTPITDLAIRIREINDANGWNPITLDDYENNVRRVPTALCLIHDEIDEAHDELCVDEGAEIDEELFSNELADVEIRVLDVVGGLTDDFDKYVMAAQAYVPDDATRAFLELHKLVSGALRVYRQENSKVEDFVAALALVYFFNRCFATHVCGVDLDMAVSRIMDKNKSREHRHGNKKV